VKSHKATIEEEGDVKQVLFPAAAPHCSTDWLAVECQSALLASIQHLLHCLMGAWWCH
jgi:hypothetical protein